MAGLLALEPFEWGWSDCIMTPAAYVEEETGKHPAPHLIRSYSTAFGARRLMIQHGGLVNLVAGFMGDFQAGSRVGVFRLGGVLMGGISDGSHVQFKTESGLMITNKATLIRGWDF